MNCSENFITAVEFDKVRSGIWHYCLGVPGKTLCTVLAPVDGYEKLKNQLATQHEVIVLRDAQKRLPLSNYQALDEHIAYLHVSGYVLPVESFMIIRNLLVQVDALKRFFNTETRALAPNLFAMVEVVPLKEHLLKTLDRVLDQNGEIKSDASDELVKIRKSIQKKKQEIDQVFKTLLGKFRAAGLLTDSEETLRNGRRVFSVPVEFKRRISGIIHDESSTGKTVYIEPDELIQVNNEFFSLQVDERKEVYKILKTLSASFQFEQDYLEAILNLLARFDLMSAIDKYSQMYDGILPDLDNKPGFQYFRAFHPLLLLKNKPLGLPIVPFDFDLRQPNRLVLLSGPNAGGKSITMKAVGLLQVMIQSGMPVPVGRGSIMGYFENFFSDIGDKQSLEDDLSTYSSHLKNMKEILEQADKNTLVLIDEFGGGTDPKMGGAIAESILKQLNYQHVWGLITTHYSNLKLFAFKTKGVVNAAMHFDKQSLKPTYKFHLGKPGSSYAFEIARKSGLSDQIIQYAKKRSIEKDSEVDELLIDVQTDKQSLENNLESLREKEKTMNMMMVNLEQARRDLEFRRKKWKMEMKEQQAQQNDREIKRLEELIKEMKKTTNLEAAQVLLNTRKRKREELSGSIQEIKEEIIYAPLQGLIQEIKAGSFVKLINGDTHGQVESVQGKNALVLIGDFRAKVALRDLQIIQAPIEGNRKKAVQYDTISQNAHFNPKIDIRGFTREEAFRMLEDFMDKAAFSSATQLEILHGKGNGVLRNAVKAKLREFKFVKSIRHPEASNGGDGITIAEIGL
jgi:DNA mismatch repair protein MutS2